MQTFTTKTGFGYLMDAQGNITDKCVLPTERQLPDTTKQLPDVVDEAGNITPGETVIVPGEIVPVDHQVKDGFTFVEVANEVELATVVVYQAPPPPETPEQRQERLIQEEMRQVAIERLKAKGKM